MPKACRLFLDMGRFEAIVIEIAGFFEVVFSAASILVVAVGGLVFLYAIVKQMKSGDWADARTTLGKFLVVALELQLAADIIATATHPTLEELGKLAAIAAIRTFLNYFLVRELREEKTRKKES